MSVAPSPDRTPDRTLVIETATAACSVALVEAGAVVDRRHEVVGRGHAERLVPMIAELLQDAPTPDAVLVDCGPGSFTGIRVGLAAARAFGLAWGCGRGRGRFFAVGNFLRRLAVDGREDVTPTRRRVAFGHGGAGLNICEN